MILALETMLRRVVSIVFPEDSTCYSKTWIFCKLIQQELEVIRI